MLYRHYPGTLTMTINNVFRYSLASLALLVLTSQVTLAAPVLQWGFNGTPGTFALLSPITDASGTGNDGYAFVDVGGTYRADIPAAERRQFTVGTSSLELNNGGIATAN